MPALLVVLAVAGVAVGAYELNRSTAATVAASGGPADGANAGSDATSTATRSATALTPSPSASPTSSPTEPTADPSADRTVAVTVLNGAGRPGLARRAATVLRTAGWTVNVGNTPTQPATTVYYPDAAQQASAQALADDLGGSPALEQSGQYGTDRVTVVLGRDFAG